MVGQISITPLRGRPRNKPEKMAGDKAYSSTSIRNELKQRKIQSVIPTRSNEERDLNFDKKTYRKRNIIERCIGWLKESRRIATRFEKLAIYYAGMLQLRMILEYL